MPRKVHHNFDTVCRWRPTPVWTDIVNSPDQSLHEHTRIDRSLGGIGHPHFHKRYIGKANNHPENCRNSRSRTGHRLDPCILLCIGTGMNPDCYFDFDDKWPHGCSQHLDTGKVGSLPMILAKDYHSTQRRTIHKRTRWCFANIRCIDPFQDDNFGLDHYTDKT